MILHFLLEHGTINKSELGAVITSPPILNRELDKMEDDGFLTITESRIGRRTYKVELTPKGRAVAEQLMKAQEIATDAIIYEEEGRIEIKNVPEEWKEKWKNLRALFHVNVFEDHVTIMETNHEGTGRERIFNIYVRENGQGHLRLWCEADESFDCHHIGYALTLAPVQDMFARVRGGK
ncbi:MAG: hypothetical protein M1344_02650 [Candidatus Thermoplasmatota archaeon]|nr:hypothetical protein [Candidatus Thermoplasmatota archaeon]